MLTGSQEMFLKRVLNSLLLPSTRIPQKWPTSNCSISCGLILSRSWIEKFFEVPSLLLLVVIVLELPRDCEWLSKYWSVLPNSLLTYSAVFWLLTPAKKLIIQKADYYICVSLSVLRHYLWKVLRKEWYTNLVTACGCRDYLQLRNVKRWSFIQ